MNMADDLVSAFNDGYRQGREDAVVRCKDCKHYETIGRSKGFGWCENIDRRTSDNFYCANGKQLNKENDEAWNLPAETKDNSIILDELIPRCTPKATELLKSGLLGAIKVCAVNECIHIQKKKNIESED